MANAIYNKGRENILGADIDWDAHDIKAVFIDEDDDVPVLATDDALEDILAGARISGTYPNLASKTKVDGVADAADTVVTTVTGDEFESLTLYKYTGVEANDLLICNIDTATGLPCTPNGGDITIQWAETGNKIFKL